VYQSGISGKLLPITIHWVLVRLFEMAGEYDMARGRAAGASLGKGVARAAEIGIGRGIELDALADGKEIQVGVIDALA
jgi:hypothetical protein